MTVRSTKPDGQWTAWAPIAGWIVFVLTALLLGTYAQAPIIPGIPPGRMAPRLPAPAADTRVLLYQLGVGSVTWFAAVVALPFMVWGARRLDAVRQRGRAIALIVLGMVALIVASATADYLLTYPAEIRGPPVLAFIPVAMRRHFLPWMAVAGGVAVIEARRRARMAAIERERLRAEAAEQRLVALTGQLQPHFLFNTLQGISTLIHRDPDAADEMLTKLSDLLRDVLRDRGRTRVPLADEVRYARTYLEIAQIRFAHRLSFDIDVPDEVNRASVPLFILQPLIENALKHGVGAVIRGGRIDVRARLQDGRIVVDVIDDGPGFGHPPPTERLGLGNTRERLRAAFANDYELSLGAGPDGGARVRIVIPFDADAPFPSEEFRD
jgi:two-component system LytT family sensor kinase